MDCQDPLEEQLLEMIQQRAGRPKICREELPTTRAARLKLVRLRFEWLNQGL